MTARAHPTPAAVADGIWRLTLGQPLRINVFFIREGDGVAIFDSATKALGPKIRRAADVLGGATRVIVGNAHPDHRGGARSIGAPVQCHVDERADMESDGGWHYFDFSALPWFARGLTKRVMRSYDDGALHVAKTLEEGDRVGDFEVVHLPGHSPGCIGLWRAADRLAITNDCFALFHPAFPFPGRRPRLPHSAFNWSDPRCAESIEKLAALEPATCWPAHYGPLTGDVAKRLRAAL
jgi:glyoxylase-like metal-dependent hydrolase (beta-lactamase superfamily II)